jgi:hypothetical protein
MFLFQHISFIFVYQFHFVNIKARHFAVRSEVVLDDKLKASWIFLANQAVLDHVFL